MSSHNLNDLHDDIQQAGKNSSSVIRPYLEQAKSELLPTMKKSFIAIEINKLWVNIPQNNEVYDTEKTASALDKLRDRIVEAGKNLITKGHE